MNTAETLNQIFKDKGIKLELVALKTGIPYSTLRHYLYQYNKIPEHKLRLICLTFGIDQKIFGLDVTLGAQTQAS